MNDTATRNRDDRDMEFPHTVTQRADVLELFDDLRPGDRVLWGDRSIPCTVARVVDDTDLIGQSLTASVIADTKTLREAMDEDDTDLRPGDVFLNPTTWGGLTGREFVLIQGPRGGFYALARCQDKGRSRPALFRAARSFHSVKIGQPGEGAWMFETWFDEQLTVVEPGDAPDELDPVGDLPAYDDIKDSRLMSYDTDDQEHYLVGTVEEAFDEGLAAAHERAVDEREGDRDDEADEADEDLIERELERADGTARQSPDNPDGDHFGTVTVVSVDDSQYGPKASLDTPAPWETPDGATPTNDVLKSLPWGDVHYSFDDVRKVWTIDAAEVSKVSSVLRDHGYDVRVDLDS